MAEPWDVAERWDATERSDATEPATGRAALAARQQAFVEAVVLGAPAPDGLDPAWVDFTRDGLVGKRWSLVRRHFPLLATALDHEKPQGGNGRAHFNTWAREHRAVGGRPLGGRLDGLTFATWLDRAGLLPTLAGGEIGTALLTQRVAPDGRTAPRTWWGIGVSRAGGVTVVGLGSARRIRRTLIRG